jgi:hypothetical protein
MKDILKKAAGLFVELPEGSPETPTMSNADILKELEKASPSAPTPPPIPTKTVEQIVRDAPGPNLDEIKVEPKSVQPIAPGGSVQFDSVYAQAGIPESSFPAEKAIQMLTDLPAELPLAAKRQTVRITMDAMGKALGVTPETVVADASRKMAALQSYADALSARTEDFVASSQLEINQLEQEISKKRALIDDTKRMLESALTSCKSESDRLDDVLEFFSLDVLPSKYAQ